MKKNPCFCLCLAAALLSAGCVRAPAARTQGLPSAAETAEACAVLEKAAEAPSDADLEGLMELLDRAEEMQPCTVGSSLRTASLAGGLLDWLRLNPHSERAARQAALRWAAGRSAAERERTGRTLHLIHEAAGRMGEDELRSLLEDAGCRLPEDCPGKDEYLSLTEALTQALTPEIFKNPGKIVNISN